MTLTYFGHSAFQLTVGETEILVDPFISGNPLASKVVDAADLNPDFILLTHAHGDHWGDTPDIAKRSNAVVVSNFEIIQYLSRKHGHDNSVAMNTGGSWNFDWGRVTQTYARHSSSFPDGTYGGNPNGFLIEAEGKTIYALGDTSLFAEMEWIGSTHAIDLALMPIGDCFTMCPDDSVRAAEMLQPALTIPIHYNTFPAIEVDTSKWVALMAESGHLTRVMGPGESLGI
jgi:L-ascorbate metabolism protein UlaG (beta-lactamase superfamily)